jgi:hypothetical protein
MEFHGKLKNCSAQNPLLNNINFLTNHFGSNALSYLARLGKFILCEGRKKNGVNFPFYHSGKSINLENKNLDNARVK